MEGKVPGLPRARSASSTSSVRGKHGRQPSPPINAIPTQVSVHPQAPSQAEVPVISTAKLIRPLFLRILHRPSPTLARPSGRLARRRQQPQQQSQPHRLRQSHRRPHLHTPRHGRSTLRRSPSRTPRFSHAPTRYHRTCAGRSCSLYATTSPLSAARRRRHPLRPTRSSHSHAYGAPRTAPLSARPPFGFPFAKGDVSSPMMTTSPPRTTGRRHHRRVPSEGVFAMSSDEDVSSGPWRRRSGAGALRACSGDPTWRLRPCLCWVPCQWLRWVAVCRAKERR